MRVHATLDQTFSDTSVQGTVTHLFSIMRIHCFLRRCRFKIGARSPIKDSPIGGRRIEIRNAIKMKCVFCLRSAAFQPSGDRMTNSETLLFRFSDQMISHRTRFDPDIEAIDGSISHFSPIFHASAKFPMESRARPLTRSKLNHRF